MRTGLSMFLCWALLVFPSASLKADAVGDIDNDGKAGLPVGITNLVLTAGLETAVPDIPLRPVFRGYEGIGFRKLFGAIA